MQYESIKSSLDKFFSGPLFMRKLLYCSLDLLLLRTWHVKRAIRRLRHELDTHSVILDAGSGFGQYTWRMSKMNGSWKIKGVDINRDHIENCSSFFNRAGLSSRVTFQTADLALYTDEANYNMILSVDVMEHIKEDEKVFLNFYKSLKAGGILLISTPSDKGGSDVHEGHEHSFIDEHVRTGYGTDEITGKLLKAGFTKVESSYTYGPPGSLSWHLSMKYPVKMLNRSYLFFIILPFYYLVFFPVSVILNFLDLVLKHKTGTGLLVIARK